MRIPAAVVSVFALVSAGACSGQASFTYMVGDEKRALWLGGPSTFVRLKTICPANATKIRVEGTLDLDPQGHMGRWLAELVAELLPKH